ncbi:MAG TPA: ParB/Srx family N-terminal domain-containing protein [Candidatus Paceibacterota bacterium]|jgi:hypothetical protein|nr:ParB/Srx family N-terminal domain-containing protein [Candidatus Paceibacterota bacterium]
MKIIKQEQSQEQLAEWVDIFLRGEGKNIRLADSLKEQKRWWARVANFPINKLVRCCGPEDGMEYKEPLERWNARVDSLMEHIRSEGYIAPLIAYYGAHYGNEMFSVRDGNHRLAACEKLGNKTLDTLIWCDSEEDFEKVKGLIS